MLIYKICSMEHFIIYVTTQNNNLCEKGWYKMSQEKAKATDVQNQLSDAVVQISTAAKQIQTNIQEVRKLVQEERDRRIAKLNQEQEELKKQYEELNSEYSEFYSGEWEKKRQICEKHGHVFKRIDSKDLGYTGRHSFLYGSESMYRITEKCMCCGEERISTSKNFGSVGAGKDVSIPEEMQKEIQEIEDKRREMEGKLKKLEEELKSLPDRYLVEVCNPLGHPLKNISYRDMYVFGFTKCPFCRREVIGIQYNLETDIGRWARLTK